MKEKAIERVFLTKANVFLWNEQGSTNVLHQDRVMRIISDIDRRRASVHRREPLGLQVLVLALQSCLENLLGERKTKKKRWQSPQSRVRYKRSSTPCLTDSTSDLKKVTDLVLQRL